MFAVEEFFAGRSGRVAVGSERFDLHVVPLGILQVPSGRLGASDPFVCLDHSFEVAVPPGRYPVDVTVADVSEALDGSHLREAYLSVRIADGVVASVVNVVPSGQEPAGDPDVFFGVGVDAGTVGFADVEAVERCMPEGDDYEDLFEPDTGDGWFAMMDDPEHLGTGFANIVLPLATAGENLVLSHSGWGDGFYPVLASRGADGALLGVHIDLQVVVGGDEPDAAEVAEPAPEPDPEPTAAPRRGLLARLLGH